MRLGEARTGERLPAELRARPDSCHVYRTTNFTPASSTDPVPFGTEAWDTAGMHSTVTNTHLITIQRSGWYVCAVGLTPTSPTVVNGKLVRNGAEAVAKLHEAVSVAGTYRVHLKCIEYLTAGDTLEVWAEPVQHNGTLGVYGLFLQATFIGGVGAAGVPSNFGAIRSGRELQALDFSAGGARVTSTANQPAGVFGVNQTTFSHGTPVAVDLGADLLRTQQAGLYLATGFGQTTPPVSSFYAFLTRTRGVATESVVANRTGAGSTTEAIDVAAVFDCAVNDTFQMDVGPGTTDAISNFGLVYLG